MSILSGSNKPVFDLREFAGYLKRSTPHPLDDKVIAAISDPQRRAVMTPDDVSALTVFGRRGAVEAVRTSDIRKLNYGFFAVAIAVDLKGDAGSSTKAIDEIRRFAGRSAANRSLEAFGLREEGSGSGFRYL